MTSARSLVGSDHHPGTIDAGTLARHRHTSRALTGARLTAPPSLSVNALVFDAEFIARFFSSVAHAIVLEKHVKVAWVEYRESAVLNGLYAALNVLIDVGTPGTAQVDTGSIDQINRDAAEMEVRLYESFITAIQKGAVATTRWLNLQDEIRASALETVQATYRDVSLINQDMVQYVQRHVARQMLIKAGATLVLKTVALKVSGLPAFLLGSAYDITLNVIDNLEQGPSATAVGIFSKSFDKLWKKGVKDLAKNAANIIKNEGDAPARKIEWLERRIAEIDAELNARGIAERSLKYGKDARKLARARDAVSAANRGAAALSVVKYGFFAFDVYKTLDRANRDLHAAGYSTAWEGVSDAFSRGN